jgi:hypothetical protein
MKWRNALERNNGDYAYGPHGEMIVHEEDDTYTVAAGDASTEYKRLSKDQVSTALKMLKVSQHEWSFE